MKREKRRQENKGCVRRRGLPSDCILIEGQEGRRSDSDEEDLRCVSCGTFEDLRGHVDAEKSSRIFYLCGRCCNQLHG